MASTGWIQSLIAGANCVNGGAGNHQNEPCLQINLVGHYWGIKPKGGLSTRNVYRILVMYTPSILFKWHDDTNS